MSKYEHAAKMDKVLEEKEEDDDNDSDDGLVMVIMDSRQEDSNPSFGL